MYAGTNLSLEYSLEKKTYWESLDEQGHSKVIVVDGRAEEKPLNYLSVYKKTDICQCLCCCNGPPPGRSASSTSYRRIVLLSLVDSTIFRILTILVSFSQLLDFIELIHRHASFVATEDSGNGLHNHTADFVDFGLAQLRRYRRFDHHIFETGA